MAKPKSRSARPARTAARKVDGGGTPDRPARPSAKDAAARAVAKPAQARSDAGPEKKAAASSGSGSTTSGPKTRPAPNKRTTPPASARYTPPVPRSEKVSPIWVPILMFACLGLGMLTIILNYVNVLPGANPSNAYLMAGLALITIGFITATKYH